MKIIQRPDGNWMHYVNEEAGEHSIYKLHIALSIDEYDTYQKQVYEKLQDAVSKNKIVGFKRLNLGNTQDIQRYNEQTQHVNARLHNNPFTIYLAKNPDIQIMSFLCRELEEILEKAKPCHSAYLSTADLSLSAHITFRQESLAGQYIAIYKATEQELIDLKTQGENSEEYQALHKNAQNKWQEKITLSEHEKYVQNFYHNCYKLYESELNKTDIAIQFRTACRFLNIDEEELKKLITDTNSAKLEEAKTLIERAYRRTSQKFHPDFINQRNTLLKTQAESLFKLLGLAKDLLEKIRKDSSVLDVKELLKQQPNLPQYQYTLPVYEYNPYYYIRMATHPGEHIVIQNWEINTIELAESKTSSERSLTLYVPQLKIYSEKDRKEHRLPGYQAFYYLLQAGALPGRFDQAHLRYCIDEKQLSSHQGQRWLLKQFLTTPSLICFLDTNDLFRLAKLATQYKILNIGQDEIEIFLYYYTQYPHTLYRRRVEKFLSNFPIDTKEISQSIIFHEKNPEQIIESSKASRKKITEAILNNSGNLHLLGDYGALDEIMNTSPELYHTIIQDKLLAEKISLPHYKYKIVEPFIKTQSHLDELTQTALTQLLLGQTKFLEILNNKKLEELKQFVLERSILSHDNPCTLPKWTIDYIDIIISSRKNMEQINSEDLLDKFQEKYKEYVIDSDKYIKELIFSEKLQNLFALSKKKLIELSQELHWSYYPLIADALLIQSTQENDEFEQQAKQYLFKTAEFLNIPIENLSIKALYKKITCEKIYITALEKAKSEWKETTSNQLLEEYRNLLFSDEKINENFIKQLKIFFKYQTIESVRSEYKKKLALQIEKVIQKLLKGDKNQTLINDFLKIKNRYCEVNSPYPWFEANNRIIEKTSSLAWEAMKYIIMDSKEKESCGFNITNNDNILEKLEELFFIYQCLDQPEEFYQALEMLISPISLSETLKNKKSFEKEEIKSALLAFLQNEMSVFIERKRENKNYKVNPHYSSLFQSHEALPEFSKLRSLYLRLGEQEKYKNILDAAYKRLKIKMSEEESKKDSKKDLVLNSYIRIREFEKDIIDETLEKASIFYKLKSIVVNKFSGLSSFFVIGFFSGTNHACVLRENFLKEYNDKEIAEIINDIFIFLKNYSDKNLASELLNEIKQDPFLNTYFKDISLDKINTDETKKIMGLIGSANPLLLKSSKEADEFKNLTNNSTRVIDEFPNNIHSKKEAEVFCEKAIQENRILSFKCFKQNESMNESALLIFKVLLSSLYNAYITKNKNSNTLIDALYEQSKMFSNIEALEHLRSFYRDLWANCLENEDCKQAKHCVSNMIAISRLLDEKDGYNKEKTLALAIQFINIGFKNSGLNDKAISKTVIEFVDSYKKDVIKDASNKVLCQWDNEILNFYQTQAKSDNILSSESFNYK